MTKEERIIYKAGVRARFNHMIKCAKKAGEPIPFKTINFNCSHDWKQYLITPDGKIITERHVCKKHTDFWKGTKIMDYRPEFDRLFPDGIPDDGKMTFEQAAFVCKVRGYIYRISKPDERYWNNHTIPLKKRVLSSDRRATDWATADSEGDETSIVG